MDFDEALRLIKRGKAVKRRGWNGQEQWLHYVKPKDFPVESDSALTNVQPIGSMAGMNPFIAIRTKDGVSTPWLASQADLLASDWETVFHDVD